MNWTEEQFAEYQAKLKLPLVGAPVEPADVPESLIEAECTKILEADGWRALRTDPVSDRVRGKGFGELGMADHLYIRYFDPAAFEEPEKKRWTEVLWVEFKRSGKLPKKHQVAWHTKERARGALTLMAGVDFPASIKGFRQWYRDSGLMSEAAKRLGVV